MQQFIRGFEKVRKVGQMMSRLSWTYIFMFHISGFHRYIYHSQTKRDSFSHPRARTPQSADRQSMHWSHTHWFSCKKQTARRVSCEKDHLQGGSPNRMHHVILNTLFQVCSTLGVGVGGTLRIQILAPKLTSRACALQVCSPPAAIAVTQAISQTLICKAIRIDSPSHAQMNKQRHKTWSFCLKYYILSKSNKIQRQVGGIFHLWQFFLEQIAHGHWPGIKKWRHVNKWKPWSFQLHCAVKPHFSVTKWKMHLLNTW